MYILSKLYRQEILQNYEIIHQKQNTYNIKQKIKNKEHQKNMSSIIEIVRIPFP